MIEKSDLLNLCHDTANSTRAIHKFCYLIQEELKEEYPSKDHLQKWMLLINKSQKEINEAVDIFYLKYLENNKNDTK